MIRLRDLGRRVVLMLLLAVPVGLTGCVERRYTIRTNPPGALVIVNDEEIGPSPVSAPFTYYGDRSITFMLDGYKTQTVVQPIKAPWYDNYLTEFFTENVIPYTFRDEREFTYDLQPSTLPEIEPLRDRGQALRSQAQTIPPPRRGGILGFFGF
jgi:hypothetical protein